MPLGETPLPQATIDAIRQWITNGAPNAPAAAAKAEVFAVQTTAPVDKATVKAAPAQILVTFTQEVDASLVNNTTAKPSAWEAERRNDCMTDASKPSRIEELRRRCKM